MMIFNSIVVVTILAILCLPGSGQAQEQLISISSRSQQAQPQIIVKSKYQHLNGENLVGIANLLQFKPSQLDLSFELKIVTYPGKMNRVYFENDIYWIEYYTPGDNK